VPGIAMLRSKKKTGERGSAVLEFAFCMSFIMIPLLMGTLVIGLNLVRAIQVTEVCRDAGHMYSYGVDFSQNTQKQMLVKLGPTLGMTTTGGNGVVVLSTVTYIDNCTPGTIPADTSCKNYGNYVFTRRLVVGNTSLHASAFGTPGTIDATTGNIAEAIYLNDSTARAAGFDNLFPLDATGNSPLPRSKDHFAFMSEMWVTSPDLSFWGYLGTMGISSRSVF
jgi:hypothetical protein